MPIPARTTGSEWPSHPELVLGTGTGGEGGSMCPCIQGIIDSFSQKSGGPLECTRARVQTSAERVRVLIWDSGPFGAVL